MVLKKANLSYNTRYIVMPKLYIEYKLKQDDMIKDIIYQERRFPLRTVQDIHGIYLVSSKELEESLIEGVRNLDAAANELLDGICLFCSTQELRYLTDAELIETIYAQ